MWLQVRRTGIAAEALRTVTAELEAASVDKATATENQAEAQKVADEAAAAAAAAAAAETVAAAKGEGGEQGDGEAAEDE